MFRRNPLPEDSPHRLASDSTYYCGSRNRAGNAVDRETQTQMETEEKYVGSVFQSTAKYQNRLLPPANQSYTILHESMSLNLAQLKHNWVSVLRGVIKKFSVWPSSVQNKIKIVRYLLLIVARLRTWHAIRGKYYFNFTLNRTRSDRELFDRPRIVHFMTNEQPNSYALVLTAVTKSHSNMVDYWNK